MRNSSKNLIRNIIIVIIAILIGIYILFNFRIFLAGPRIEIFSPLSGSVVTESLIQLEGQAQNISHITLNTRQIFVDEEGFFDEFLLLQPGYNIIVIELRDKFGRVKEEKVELVFNGSLIEANLESLGDGEDGVDGDGEDVGENEDGAENTEDDSGDVANEANEGSPTSNTGDEINE